ncbi:MAG: chemotaxis protein [Mucispirillum sp.]|nr:chemotaxis protein [Mucispirillum sp.]
MSEFKDLNELLSIARNINEGKYDVVDVTVEPESELYEIARYFNDSLKKLQTVSSVMEGAYGDLPAFEKVLNTVISDSKHASEDVLAFVDKINFNIDDIKENLELVHQFVSSGDYARAGGMLDRLSECAVRGYDICCDIVSSLEFKEITKSKIDDSINVVNSLEERLAAVLVKLGIKQNIIDVEVLDKIKDTKEILQDQDLVDKLLKEFGV